MTQPREYPTAHGFRRALLAHLRKRAVHDQVDPQRLQRLVAFDRFLARLFVIERAPWLVKGGYAMELRLHGRARATQDVDLAIPDARDLTDNNSDPLEAAHELLQEAAERDLDDHFTFRVGEPKQELDGPPYGGVRFKIDARIGGETFSMFQLDVSIGDAVIGAAEWRTAEPLLDFAGIAPVRVPVLPAEQQFAEKLHAFTLPRGDQLNTRVKELADLVLLIEFARIDIGLVGECVKATFSRRATHGIPDTLDEPSQQWRERYAAFADECGLRARTLEEAFTELSSFWSRLSLHWESLSRPRRRERRRVRYVHGGGDDGRLRQWLAGQLQALQMELQSFAHHVGHFPHGCAGGHDTRHVGHVGAVVSRCFRDEDHVAGHTNAPPFPLEIR